MEDSNAQKLYTMLSRSSAVLNTDIIGVFDIESATSSPHTQNFLKGINTLGGVEEPANLTEPPRSFIATIKGVRLSITSAQTIYERNNKKPTN